MAYNTSRLAAAAAARAREEADIAAALEASRAEEAARQRTLAFFQQPTSLPWGAQQPEVAPDASSSTAGGGAAAAADGGWGASGADVAGWGAATSGAPDWGAPSGLANAGWGGDAGPGGGGGLGAAQPATAAAAAGQQQANGGGYLQFYDASAKQSMPEYRGGWDVGPAAVAAVAGRGSAASLAPAGQDLWQLQLNEAGSLAAQRSAGLHGSLSHADSASSVSDAPPPQGAAAAAPAMMSGWGAAPSQLPRQRPVTVTASFAHPGSFAALPLHHQQRQQQQQQQELQHQQYQQQAAHAASLTGLPNGGTTSTWGAAAAALPLKPAMAVHQQPEDASELDALMQLMGI